MHTQRIELAPEMTVEIVECAGDLSIRGTEEATLVVEVSKEKDISFEQGAGKVTLRLGGDARLRVLQAIPLTLRQLGKDLKVRGLNGPLDIGEVEGDVIVGEAGDVRLSNVRGDIVVGRAGTVRSQGYLDDDVVLRRVEAVELVEVGGDLTVSGATSLSLDRVDGDVHASVIAGEVRLKEVRGDVSLRDVAGAVEMGRVGGDLDGRDLCGDVVVTRVDGDITLSTALQADRRYRMTGRHDIRVRFPEGTAARFDIQARRWTVPSGDAVHEETPEEGRAVVQLGQGGPEVLLVTDGDVFLGPAGDDWERCCDDFGRQMGDWGERFGRQMEQWGEELRGRLEGVEWERVGKEIEEATGRIAHLVESRLEEIDVDEISRRAQATAAELGDRVRDVDWERIGRKVERATRHGMHRVQAGLQRLQERLRRQEATGVVPPPPPVSPVAVEVHFDDAPPADSLDEERLAVLQMVEEGRLTADEAAALLDALE